MPRHLLVHRSHSSQVWILEKSRRLRVAALGMHTSKHVLRGMSRYQCRFAYQNHEQKVFGQNHCAKVTIDCYKISLLLMHECGIEVSGKKNRAQPWCLSQERISTSSFRSQVDRRLSPFRGVFCGQTIFFSVQNAHRRHRQDVKA